MAIDRKYLFERGGYYDGPPLVLENDNGRLYLPIALKGFEYERSFALPLELELVEVKCGHECAERTQIESIVRRNFPNAIVTTHD